MEVDWTMLFLVLFSLLVYLGFLSLIIVMIGLQTQKENKNDNYRSNNRNR